MVPALAMRVKLPPPPVGGMMPGSRHTAAGIGEAPVAGDTARRGDLEPGAGGGLRWGSVACGSSESR